MSDPTWPSRLAGQFIVLDGPDGSGKSTQFRRLSALAADHGVTVCEVREPGGTDIGERVRAILLDPAVGEMDVRCEMLLYMASRAQLIAERIRPALRRGELVLADRFISSTLAYQGAAGGMDEADIRRVGDVAVAGRGPDLVVVFDVDAETAAGRLNPLLDRMEAKGADYHRRVRRGYLDQADAEPDRYLVIDARPDADAVTNDLLQALARRFSDQTAGRAP